MLVLLTSGTCFSFNSAENPEGCDMGSALAGWV